MDKFFLEFNVTIDIVIKYKKCKKCKKGYFGDREITFFLFGGVLCLKKY